MMQTDRWKTIEKVVMRKGLKEERERCLLTSESDDVDGAQDANKRCANDQE
jgi:hypothetical protein